jgi:putative nucleotidyltransferase with HDIG domain
MFYMSEKKKILIVEDDEILRETLASILDKKYLVVETLNGAEAKKLITLTQFDLILSDVQMPFCTGVELLQWVKENHPTKFILMTGFAHILETHKAQELGADDFLAKPFSNADLKDKIDALIDPQPISSEIAPPKAVVNLDSMYCKIPIEDFVTDKEFQYDLFIRINQNKYLKIAHKGGKIPSDRAQVYKDKGLHFFYISKKDFGKLVGFTMAFSKVVLESKTIDQDKKDRFIRYTGEMVLQHTYVNGLDDASYSVAKDLTTLSLETLSEDNQMLNVLNNFNEHADFLYAHALAVSTFSVIIANALGWTSQPMIFKLSMAGLFHDIGKKEIPKEILLKSRAEQSQKERELVESHPSRGKEILETLKQVPSEVCAVAYEHHENILETGYPRKIRYFKIHPFAKIVMVADIFANYTVKNPSQQKPVNAREAIMLMESNHKGLIDEAAFEALKKSVTEQK